MANIKVRVLSKSQAILHKMQQPDIMVLGYSPSPDGFGTMFMRKTLFNYQLVDGIYAKTTNQKTEEGS